MSWELYLGGKTSIICLKLTLLPKIFGCPEGRYLRVCVSKRHPDARLVKTIIQGLVGLAISMSDFCLEFSSFH